MKTWTINVTKQEGDAPVPVRVKGNLDVKVLVGKAAMELGVTVDSLHQATVTA